MLVHLRVVNLGVLADVSIDPSEGFTVVTGETGAGKTLLLGGLRLLLGAQAGGGGVGPLADLAQVDGLFADFEVELGASRVVPREGRSRAHLEGSIVSAATLAERLGPMVEIIGQHDQLEITRSAHLLSLLDSSLDDVGGRSLTAYRDAWAELSGALERQRMLGGDQIGLTRELDLARYQVGEIDRAVLEPGADEQIEVAVSRLRNVEEIREHLSESVLLAEGMADSVGEMVARLRKAAGLVTDLSPLAAEAEGLASVVSELARTARSATEGLEADPGLLVELEERLTAIGDLKRKYGRTLDDVIAHGEDTARRVTELESLIADSDRIDSLVAAGRADVAAAGRALSEARRETAETMAETMRRHLADLGLRGCKVEIDVQPADPGPSGADRVDIRFASDARLRPAPVSEIASGGELSRLVLALRLATRGVDSGTLVFDEVDTGIGGKTALAMGRKLADLARVDQVLCVTHLAQVAAHADTHYVVERGEDGSASVRRVEGGERVTEIARMLAGQPESTAGRTAAAELLESAAK